MLIGEISLDDYELKFERLLRHSKYRTNVLHLPKGVFLYPKLDMLIGFSKFTQNGKPYLWKAKPKDRKDKPKGFLSRIWNWLNKPREQHGYTDLKQLSNEDSEGDGLMSLEDEDILFPPEFEDE